MLKYLKGDLFKNIQNKKEDEIYVLPHSVNNCNGWGSGYVIPLGKNFPVAEKSYRNFFKINKGLTPAELLGKNDYVETLDNFLIVNMFAQDNTDFKKNRLTSYPAMSQCMLSLKEYLIKSNKQNISLHLPMICSGIGGADWNVVEEFINWHWTPYFQVTVYQL